MKDIAILGGFLFVSYLLFGKPKTTEKAIIQDQPANIQK